MKFIAFIAFFVAIMLFGLFNAWLFIDMWEWFIVPILNVKVMNIAQAFGFLMVIGWFITPILANLQSIEGIMSTSPTSFWEKLCNHLGDYVKYSTAHVIAWGVSKFIVLSYM